MFNNFKNNSLKKIHSELCIIGIRFLNVTDKLWGRMHSAIYISVVQVSVKLLKDESASSSDELIC